MVRLVCHPDRLVLFLDHLLNGMTGENFDGMSLKVRFEFSSGEDKGKDHLLNGRIFGLCASKGMTYEIYRMLIFLVFGN